MEEKLADEEQVLLPIVKPDSGNSPAREREAGEWPSKPFKRASPANF